MTGSAKRWLRRSTIAAAMVAAGGLMTLGGATEAQARGCGGYGYGGYGGWGAGYGYAPRPVVVARPVYGYGGYGYPGRVHRVGYGGYPGGFYGGRGGISIGFGF